MAGGCLIWYPVLRDWNTVAANLFFVVVVVVVGAAVVGEVLVAVGVKDKHQVNLMGVVVMESVVVVDDVVHAVYTV